MITTVSSNLQIRQEKYMIKQFYIDSLILRQDFPASFYMLLLAGKFYKNINFAFMQQYCAFLQNLLTKYFQYSLIKLELFIKKWNFKGYSIAGTFIYNQVI